MGTVGNRKRKYGSDGLDRHYVPYQGKLRNEDLAALEQAFESWLYRNCDQVGHWIKQNLGVSYREFHTGHLEQAGAYVQKDYGAPRRACVAEQSRFLKELVQFPEEIDQLSEVEYFMDPLHPQHITRSDYALVNREEDKEIQSNSGHRCININGAMNAHEPSDKEIVEAERINVQVVQQTLEKRLRK